MPEQKLHATRALHKHALPTFFLWVWQMHHSVFVQGGQYMKGPSGALQAGRKISGVGGCHRGIWGGSGKRHDDSCGNAPETDGE